MRELSELELGWLAGLLEGEGCFTTTGRKRPYIAVCLQTTDADVIERAAEMIGVPVHRMRTTSPMSAKPQYRTQLQGRRAAELMRLVRPHMGLRRGGRIDELLGLYGAANGGRLELSS